LKNLLFRLSPYESYKSNYVKKIKVLSVTERNTEASIRIDVIEATFTLKKETVKLRFWKLKADGTIEEKEQIFKKGESLYEKSNKNPVYYGYDHINFRKDLIDGLTYVEFSNGVVLTENKKESNIQALFEIQLYWLIHEHFKKKEHLKPLGIKCLFPDIY
jgi:type III restriction enzyme